MPQTGSADSVDVLLDVSREVEVEDVRDVRHVDTPGEKNYTFSDLGSKAQYGRNEMTYFQLQNKCG